MSVFAVNGYQQGAFGGNPDRSVPGDTPLRHRRLPLLLVGKDLIARSSQLRQRLLREVLRGHVLQRLATHHVVGRTGTQQLEKVDSALACGALKPGEPRVADVRAVPVLALVTRSCVIHVNVPRHPQTHPKDRVLLLVELLLALREETMQLAGRDLHSPLAKLLQDQRFGHLGVVVLIEYKATQRRSEVPHGRLDWQLARDPRALRGEPLLNPIPRGLHLDHKLLHDIIVVALESASLRHLLRIDHDRTIDRPRVLWLVRALASPPLRVLLVQSRGLNRRFRLLFLQASHFVTQRLVVLSQPMVLFPQRRDHLQQRLHPRRTFPCRRKFG